MAVFRPALAALAALLLVLPAAGTSAAPAGPKKKPDPQELVVDLSNHEVAISVDFAGADLVLFGATEGVGDVIVEVRGPYRREAVRRKERIAGVWLNRDEVVFDRVPAFYAVASSRPLADVMSPSALREERVGVENLLMLAEEELPAEHVAEFRAALIRNKQAMRLFSNQVAEVRFLGSRLFRTDIRFPSSAAVGPYQVNVLLVKNGEVTSSTRTPLLLSRVGFEAEVFELAHTHSLAYGILAVVIAAMAGWLASVFFRNKA